MTQWLNNISSCFYFQYLETGKSQLAIKAFRNATLQKPDHVNAWSNMAILLDNIGRYYPMYAMNLIVMPLL